MIEDVSVNRVASAIITVDNSRLLNLNTEPEECLFDSGATCCVVKRSLVDENTLTGKDAMCTRIDGSIRYFPTANIEIESEYYNGEIEPLVMENPVKLFIWVLRKPTIIIGKINGLKYLLGRDKDEEKISSSDDKNSKKNFVPGCKRSEQRNLICIHTRTQRCRSIDRRSRMRSRMVDFN